MPPADPGLQSPQTRDAARLDQPPPTMAAEMPNTPPASFADLASPAAESGMDPALGGGGAPIPEPILRGMLELGMQLSQSIDALAQNAPQFSADFALVQMALQRALAKITEAQGAAPSVSPTETGSGFPGGLSSPGAAL